MCARMTGSAAMGKEHQNKKETKKQPVLTPKEKKAAKKAKKQGSAGVPTHGR